MSKKSSAEVIALFNASTSGKSFIKVEGDTMFMVSKAVHNMCVEGKIKDIEFVAGQDLMDRDDATKVAFKTMNVKGFTPSATSVMAEKAALCVAYSNIDESILEKAQALANKYSV